ncbi:MAG: NAD(P)H-hydrate epimerase [Proteobacteria bacterium]|nr:MAG: NAD(P)H-hydrate epimerase [Pseudomonadota bacterium]
MIWTASDAKEIDRLSSEVYGIPASDLMEAAGQAIFRLALSLWKPHCKFLVLAGAGNNGGDALVVARLLFEQGFSPRVIDVTEGKESVERGAQRRKLEALGCPLYSPKVLVEDEGPWIILDGLLGIGLSGFLRDGLVSDVLQRASKIRSFATLAIDLPSGLDADCFDQTPPLLKATHTITFQSLKPLHVVYPSREYCGIIHLANDIGFSPQAVRSVMAAQSVKLRSESRATSLDQLWSFFLKGCDARRNEGLWRAVE